MRVLPINRIVAAGGLLASAFAASPVRFQEFIESAPANPEVHASTLVEAAPQVFVAAWFSGSKEGHDDVTIWSARRTSAGWSKAHSVARGLGPDGTPRPTYNPVLFVPSAGRLALIYSVGRPRERWLPYVMWSDDAGASWSVAGRLPDAIRGPDRNQPLVVEGGGLLHPSTEGPGRHVHVEFSDSTLTRWSRGLDIPDPDGFQAIQPTLLDHDHGRIQMICRTYARELATAWSDDGGHTWTPLSGLGLYAANSAIDAVRLADGRFLLVYNPSGKPANSAVWGERVPLAVAVSRDGESWQRVYDLETSPLREGYAYPCAVLGSDHLVHLTYTWGRKRIRYVVFDPAQL